MVWARVLHGERLGEAGYALDEDVASHSRRDQQAVDEVALADDRPADLGANGIDEAGFLLHASVDCIDFRQAASQPSTRTALRLSIEALTRTCCDTGRGEGRASITRFDPKEGVDY